MPTPVRSCVGTTEQAKLNDYLAAMIRLSCKPLQGAAKLRLAGREEDGRDKEVRAGESGRCRTELCSFRSDDRLAHFQYGPGTRKRQSID